MEFSGLVKPKINQKFTKLENRPEIFVLNHDV